jgi:hypothetical protein
MLVETLLVISVGAEDYYHRKDMQVRIDEKTAEEIKITVVKGEEVKIDFEAIIDCQSRLDIIAINESRDINLIFSDSAGYSAQGGGCRVSDSLTLTSETKGEDYTLIILSPGKPDESGAYIYGKGKEISELLADWKILKEKGKDREQITAMIIDDTIGVAGSGDSAAIRKIIVTTEGPWIKIERKQWTDKSRTKIRIYGTTNLPEDTIIEWRFVSSLINIEGDTEVDWNKNIRFTINVGNEKIKGEDCLLTLKRGKFITDKIINLSKPQKITPTPTPTIISKPTPVRTPMPMPEEWIVTPHPPETSIEMPDIAIALVLAATIVFLKKKNNFRDK